MSPCWTDSMTFWRKKNTFGQEESALPPRPCNGLIMRSRYSNILEIRVWIPHYLPYSPELLPSEYFLIPKLKLGLSVRYWAPTMTPPSIRRISTNVIIRKGSKNERKAIRHEWRLDENKLRNKNCFYRKMFLFFLKGCGISDQPSYTELKVNLNCFTHDLGTL